MPLVSPILKEVVEEIPDCIYLRASDLEANIDVDSIDMSGKTLVIYNNRPDVENSNGNQGSFVTRQWPVECQILQLADMDDNEVDSDTIRAACIVIADTIFDKMQIRTLNQVASIDGYDFTFEEEVKVYDKILTGLMLLFVFPMERDEYYCNVTTP